MKFILYVDMATPGQNWRWKLKARNGRIVADSGEAYANKGDAMKAIRLVKCTNSKTPVEVLDVPGEGEG